MELMTASNEWAFRPADERFWTLQEMKERACALHAASEEAKPLPVNSFNVKVQFPKSFSLMQFSCSQADKETRS